MLNHGGLLQKYCYSQIIGLDYLMIKIIGKVGNLLADNTKLYYKAPLDIYRHSQSCNLNKL